MADSARLLAFLARHGYDQAVRIPIPGDASIRSYCRLLGGPNPAVLMTVPQDDAALPHQGDLRPFVNIAHWLCAHGWSAPRIYGVDVEGGLLLLEDLGDDLFKRHLEWDSAGSETELYQAAVDQLLALQAARPPEGLPTYDRTRFLAEASLLLEWHAPRLPPAASDAFLEIWTTLLPLTRTGAEVFVYVDYHAENLIWLPHRRQPARVGLLDFQDARIGPPAYDLASLLQDARRDVSEAVVTAMIDRYLAARSDLPEADFLRAYAVLGAQRSCKILGLFSRLARRDGKTRYLHLLDRVQRNLERNLDHPCLSPLRRWFDTYVGLNTA